MQIFKIFLRIMVNSFWEVLRDTIIIPADHSAYRTVPSATPWCFKFQPFLHWFIQVREGKPNEEEAWITCALLVDFLSPLIFHRSCSRLMWMYRMKVSVQNLQLAHFGSNMRTFCSFHPTCFKTQRWFFLEGFVHLVLWTPHTVMCHCPPFRCIAARSFHMQYANMHFFLVAPASPSGLVPVLGRLFKPSPVRGENGRRPKSSWKRGWRQEPLGWILWASCASSNYLV